MTQLIIATHNAHKLKEFQAAFAQTDFILSSASDHTIADIPETGTTFEENAVIKAQAVLDQTSIAAIGDDSGLVVSALKDEKGEFPGLFSKRFADDCGGYDEAVQELLRQLDGRPATAYYTCTLAFCRPDDEPIIAEGRVTGRLVYPARGDSTFGYDRWFQPDGDTRTFGEMTTDEKRHYDHRSKAITRLLKLIND